MTMCKNYRFFDFIFRLDQTIAFPVFHGFADCFFTRLGIEHLPPSVKCSVTVVVVIVPC